MNESQTDVSLLKKECTRSNLELCHGGGTATAIMLVEYLTEMACKRKAAKWQWYSVLYSENGRHQWAKSWLVDAWWPEHAKKSLELYEENELAHCEELHRETCSVRWNHDSELVYQVPHGQIGIEIYHIILAVWGLGGIPLQLSCHILSLHQHRGYGCGMHSYLWGHRTMEEIGVVLGVVGPAVDVPRLVAEEAIQVVGH